MDQVTPQQEVRRILGSIFLVFAAVILPGTVWTLFGWLHALLPLLVFTYLCRYGVTLGCRFILAGTGLATLAGLLVPSLHLPLFSLAMVPAGYILARSGLQGDGPASAGLKGAAAMVGSWALLIAVLGAITGASPYASLIGTLHTGIDEALGQYRQSGSLDPEAMMVLETTLHQMKVVLPVIMPAIFVSCALLTVWGTMVVGNRLAARFCQRSIWPQYRHWQLPDRLVWLGIGCAVPLLFPGAARNIGINLLIVLSVIYCLQGLAVCVFFMNKWRVPLLLRSFLYVMIVFQSFGTQALLSVGVADIWFDFRRLNPVQPSVQEKSRDD